jgi:hypothetical protein
LIIASVPATQAATAECLRIDDHNIATALDDGIGQAAIFGRQQETQLVGGIGSVTAVHLVDALRLDAGGECDGGGADSRRLSRLRADGGTTDPSLGTMHPDSDPAERLGIAIKRERRL